MASNFARYKRPPNRFGGMPAGRPWKPRVVPMKPAPNTYKPPVKPTPAPSAGVYDNQPQAQQRPFDARFEQARATATQRWQDSQLGFEARRQAVKQDYGFDDVSNPFNRAALLQKSYTQGQQARTNTSASSGQLYAGSAQNSQNEGTSRFNQSHDALRRDYQSTLAGLSQEEIMAKMAYEDQMLDYDEDSIEGWGPDSAVPGPDGPASGVPGKPVYGKPGRAKGRPQKTSRGPRIRARPGRRRPGVRRPARPGARRPAARAPSRPAPRRRKRKG